MQISCEELLEPACPYRIVPSARYLDFKEGEECSFRRIRLEELQPEEMAG